MKEKSISAQSADTNSQKQICKLDWCTHDAAVYSVKNWHYSKCMPAGKSVKIGVWEEGKFIGCIIFSRGANPNLHRPFNLDITEVCELTRIALNKHKTPVSRLVKIALNMLKKHQKLKLVISFADINENHLGKIYQAGNWIYTGIAPSTPKYYLNGRWMHQRSVGAAGYSTKNWTGPRMHQEGKHRYLYVLDKSIKDRVIHLKKPYPKINAPVVKQLEQTANQQEDGSANLTQAHHA